MGSRRSSMLTLNPQNAYAWLVLCSLNSALRREKAMGEEEVVPAVLFPGEAGETTGTRTAPPVVSLTQTGLCPCGTRERRSGP